MDIRILHLLEGARRAEGVAVIIDVFRAFSTACYVYAGGARSLLAVGDIGEACRLKEEDPSRILMGERGGKKPPGFDFGNSPARLLGADLAGREAVLTTSSGTQGLAAAARADRILTGSFVNADAIVGRLRELDPPLVSLVCMGVAGTAPADEDEACAGYLRARLEGRSVDFPAMVRRMRKGTGARFFDPAGQEDEPAEDFALCARVGVFPFVLEAEREGAAFRCRRIDIGSDHGEE